MEFSYEWHEFLTKQPHPDKAAEKLLTSTNIKCPKFNFRKKLDTCAYNYLIEMKPFLLELDQLFHLREDNIDLVRNTISFLYHLQTYFILFTFLGLVVDVITSLILSCCLYFLACYKRYHLINHLHREKQIFRNLEAIYKKGNYLDSIIVSSFFQETIPFEKEEDWKVFLTSKLLSKNPQFIYNEDFLSQIKGWVESKALQLYVQRQKFQERLKNFRYHILEENDIMKCYDLKYFCFIHIYPLFLTFFLNLEMIRIIQLIVHPIVIGMAYYWNYNHLNRFNSKIYLFEYKKHMLKCQAQEYLKDYYYE